MPNILKFEVTVYNEGEEDLTPDEVISKLMDVTYQEFFDDCNVKITPIT